MSLSTMDAVAAATRLITGNVVAVPAPTSTSTPLNQPVYLIQPQSLLLQPLPQPNPVYVSALRATFAQRPLPATQPLPKSTSMPLQMQLQTHSLATFGMVANPLLNNPAAAAMVAVEDLLVLSWGTPEKHLTATTM